jgi:hypothetical protein
MSTDAVEESVNTDIPNPNENTNDNLLESDVNTLELTEPFDREAFGKVRGHKVRVFHRIARPNIQQLQERDDKQPYRSQMVNEDRERLLSDVSGRADAELYDQLVLLTEGYKYNVVDGQDESARTQALNSVPRAHKSDMMRAILEVKSEVVPEGEEEVDTFVWGQGLTYRIRTEIGDQGQFVAYSTMREPTNRQLDDYSLASTDFEIEKGQRKPITRVHTKLAPAVQLFDELVDAIEGFTVNGKPINVKDKRQLALVDPYFKRSVLDALMKETRLDLGN